MKLQHFVILNALFFAGCAGMDTTIALDYTGKDGRSIGTSIRLSRPFAKGADGADTTVKRDADGNPNFGPK
jgi:hypothetical protein